MGREIERKYLLRNRSCVAQSELAVPMVQGYFETPPGCTVRVRLAGDRAFLTVKGRGNGLTRSEFEYEIPPVDAREMLSEFCANRVVKKVRYRIPFADHIWEVDLYEGRHAGLATAEIELDDERENFAVPPWIGEELTGNPAWTNRALALNPELPQTPQEKSR